VGVSRWRQGETILDEASAILGGRATSLGDLCDCSCWSGRLILWADTTIVGEVGDQLLRRCFQLSVHLLGETTFASARFGCLCAVNQTWTVTCDGADGPGGASCLWVRRGFQEVQTIEKQHEDATRWSRIPCTYPVDIQPGL
jgi:hypothetical protein